MHRLLLMYRRTLTLVVASSVIAMISGCGRGDGFDRAVVSGTVTLDGTPAEVGQIRFIPQGDTPGPVTIEPIENGGYLCEHKGGVPAGEHRVEVLIWDPKVPPPRGPGGPQRPQWAPEQFNQKSELTFTVNDDGGKVVKDWALTGGVR
jgi:hypothetical protein